MKKLLSVILILSIVFLPCITASAQGETLALDAKSAVLMDVNTGKVLYALKENERLSPASITKVMSLILVMEAVESGKMKLSDKITASKNAVSFGGSQIWLEEGEQMSVDDMVKAVTVASANDACTALGEAVSGSSEGFVAAMNAKAKQLGLKNTSFENCTGLDEEVKHHFSSAYDIAVMSKELMRYDLIKKYSTIWMDSLRGGKTELVNTNRLVRFYQGCIGLKTGTTTKAGFCVSAVAEREGTTLCAVILGAKNSDERFNSAAKLLDYGFSNYESVSPKIDISQAEPVKVSGGLQSYATPVLAQKDFRVTVPKGKSGNVSTKIEMKQSITAPVEKGQVIGKVTVYLGKDTLGSADIVSAEAIGKLTFWEALKKLLQSITTNLN